MYSIGKSGPWRPINCRSSHFASFWAPIRTLPRVVLRPPGGLRSRRAGRAAICDVTGARCCRIGAIGCACAVLAAVVGNAVAPFYIAMRRSPARPTVFQRLFVPPRFRCFVRSVSKTMLEPNQRKTSKRIREHKRNTTYMAPS